MIKSPPRRLSATAIGVVVALLASASADAQSNLKILTNNNQVIETVLGYGLHHGSLPGVVYGFPGPVLAARPAQVVQCVVNASPQVLTGKRTTFDQNGYFEPTVLPAGDFPQLTSLRGGWVDAGEALTVVAGEISRYSLADYLPFTTPTGGGTPLTLAVDGIQGRCFLMPMVDSTPAAPACNTVEQQDELFGGRFETLSQGVLAISVTAAYANPPLNTRVDYTYTLQAVDGPVFAVNLREQFPYYTQNQTGLPTFARSLKLEELWTCSASAGASCDSSQGNSAYGVGFARTNGGILGEAGACLTVTAQRAVRSDGLHGELPFSNRLHVGATYQTAATENGAGEHAVRTARLPFTPAD